MTTGEEIFQKEHLAAYRAASSAATAPFDLSMREAEKTAAEFAKQAIQAGFVLNGGALAALPAAAGLLGIKATEFPALYGVVALLIAGLVISSAATYFAFSNFTLRAARYRRLRDAAAEDVRRTYVLHPTDADYAKSIKRSESARS